MFTQKDLAERWGRSQATISNWAAKRWLPRPDCIDPPGWSLKAIEAFEAAGYVDQPQRRGSDLIARIAERMVVLVATPDVPEEVTQFCLLLSRTLADNTLGRHLTRGDRIDVAEVGLVVLHAVCRESGDESPVDPAMMDAFHMLTEMFNFVLDNGRPTVLQAFVQGLHSAWRTDAAKGAKE